MEYNLLTLQLLTEGYSAEHYPDFVQIDNSKLSGNNPLHNLGGGFLYKRWYLEKMVFKTPCGRYVMGRNVLDNMWYMGIGWQPENNNPVLRCPFTAADFRCELNHPLLGDHVAGGGLCIQMMCACHQTTEPYDYANSIEKLDAERRERKEQKYQEFVAARYGRVCINHAYFDERNEEWHFRYSPEVCVHRCFSEYCPVLGKTLSKKKANVYYDLYKKGIYVEGLIQEPWERVEKGIRFFEHPVSIDICEAFVRLQSKEIYRKYRVNHGMEYLADSSLTVEVRNIRVESRPSRDLEQDLLDLSEGRFVSWAPAEEKKKKEEKRLRRKQNQEKRILKLEQKIRTSGYECLDAAEQIRAEKVLGQERIEQLVVEHEEFVNRPIMVQMNLLELTVQENG